MYSWFHSPTSPFFKGRSLTTQKWAIRGGTKKGQRNGEECQKGEVSRWEWEIFEKKNYQKL